MAKYRLGLLMCIGAILFLLFNADTTKVTIIACTGISLVAFGFDEVTTNHDK